MLKNWDLSVFLFCLNLLLSSLAWSEIYYQPPKSCSGSPLNQKQLPKRPLRFLSNMIQNQGKTPTCGFHAGTVLLEALAQSRMNFRPGLSVVDCMEKLGFCKKSDLEFSKTSLVPFLLNMRKIKKVRPFSETVDEHYSNLCSQEQVFGHLANISNSLLDLESSELNKNSVHIPDYNIKTWDFNGTESPEQVSKELFSYFNKRNSLPLAFSSCEKDPATSNDCTNLHGIALIGVKKIKCEDNTIFYNGIFKNSYGQLEEEYDLESMLKGMIKFKLGYLTVLPCKGSDCLSPPILVKEKSNLIYHLAESGDIDSIKKIKSKYPKIDIESGVQGVNPLYIATQNGHLNIVKYLVENGANKDIQDNDGATPLYVAARKGYLDIVECLVKNGANKDIQDNDGFAPLHIAAQQGHLNVVEYLVENRANKDIQTKHGATPLYIAAQQGHLDIVECLVKKGANKDIQKTDGATPLYIAAQQGHLNIVEYLLKNGANKDIQDNNGFAPLHIAAQQGYLDIVKYLVENGANKDIQTKHGSTPMYIAAQQGHLDIVECLVKNGANKDIQTKHGSTPMYIAAHQGHLDIVKYLVKNRANKDIQDNDGSRATSSKI